MDMGAIPMPCALCMGSEKTCSVYLSQFGQVRKGGISMASPGDGHPDGSGIDFKKAEAMNGGGQKMAAGMRPGFYRRDAL